MPGLRPAQGRLSTTEFCLIMHDTLPSQQAVTLWGGALSLYSGKVRSYLIKKGIPYREFYASHPDFQARIRPIVGLGVTPVVETDDGDVLQDSTEIIEALERKYPARPMIPQTPVLRTLAWLLDAYASEHLLTMAMHFRWAEPHVSKQRSFLHAEFGRVSYIGSDWAQRDVAGQRMVAYFSHMLESLGSQPKTSAAIEEEYAELLACLEAHFQHVPYLLGGHPSLADFGFMAPLYAHLGRDPAPAYLMAFKAPNVARWIERMNLAVIPDGEYPDIAPAWDPADAIPPTLVPLLELIFSDWSAELQAHALAYNTWIDANPDLPKGSLVALDGKKRVHPHVGPISFQWRGCTVRRLSAPQALWHFSRFQQQLQECPQAAMDMLVPLLHQLGGREACAIRLSRPIVRSDYALRLGT